MSVGPTVAANIVFVVICDFCILLLSKQYALQYTTENLSGHQSVLISPASVDIQPTLDSSPSNKEKHVMSETTLFS